MKITWKQLRHLPVVTKGGLKLGVVIDLELSAEAHVVEAYLVRPSQLTRTLTEGPLRVHRSQVVSLSAERMVVDDAVRRETQPAKSVAPVPA